MKRVLKYLSFTLRSVTHFRLMVTNYFPMNNSAANIMKIQEHGKFFQFIYLLEHNNLTLLHIIQLYNDNLIFYMQCFSRRRQSNLHPVHGRPEILVKGLAGYNKEVDRADLLSPERM